MWTTSTVARYEKQPKDRPAQIKFLPAPGVAEPRMRNMVNPEVSRGFLLEKKGDRQWRSIAID